MAKPKAINRALTLLRDAIVVDVYFDRRFELTTASLAMASAVPVAGRSLLIPVEDAEPVIKALVADDARTRLDPTQRKPRKQPKKVKR